MMKQRIVIKVGTSTLLESHDQSNSAFEAIAHSIKNLSGLYNIVLVTSGAVGFGMHHLSLTQRLSGESDIQALSAIGQIGLMERWRGAFQDSRVGQILLTANELSRSDSLKVTIGTITSLWSLDVLPIVNGNRAVAGGEAVFGDNDMLAARIATHIGAEKLILLTDQDGVQENFGTKDQARIHELGLLEAEKHIAEEKSYQGTGGMKSKLSAAKVALDSNTEAYIAHGSKTGSIEAVLAGKAGTKIVQ